MAIQLIVRQCVTHNRIFLRKCARWSRERDGGSHHAEGKEPRHRAGIGLDHGVSRLSFLWGEVQAPQHLIHTADAFASFLRYPLGQVFTRGGEEMRRIRLTATDQAHLEQLFTMTDDRRLRDRCQAVLMASRGRQRKTIAQDLGVHRTTVGLWLKHYHAQGVAGLQIHWAPGPPGRIPETLGPTIQAWGQDGPQGCGLDRAHWTYEE